MSLILFKTINRASKSFVLKTIRFYQKTGAYRNPITRGTCRFQPTCAQYTYEAIKRYGIVRGIILGTIRIAKCHPWLKGGIDPLPKF